MKKRIIIAITGASGVIYGVKLLELLRDEDIETHLIISPNARLTFKLEYAKGLEKAIKLADIIHSYGNISASIASGSFINDGMIISPCSIKTMSEIACGITGNLISRAADVCLKERRKLLLMVRESPLHAGHLENMLKLSNLGAIIAPPLPAFYNMPENIADIVTDNVCHILDIFGIYKDKRKRWGE